MNNKKGLSTVVTTLMIVLLVLIAIGVVWVVVSNLMGSAEESIEFQEKCREVSFTSQSLNCATATGCVVTVNRGGGGENVTGIKLVFNTETQNQVIGQAGNILPLATRTFTVAAAELAPVLGDDVTGVDIVAYFEDGEGNEVLCSS